MANRLALQDGSKAAEWALSFADGSPERVNAVAGLVPGWYEKDPKAVCDWLNGLKEGPAHDAGAAALVTICTEPAPEIALQWAQNISDETQRSALTGQVASRWLAADPEKAGAWMEKTTVLTTEQREMILMHDRMFRNVSGAARNGR